MLFSVLRNSREELNIWREYYKLKREQLRRRSLQRVSLFLNLLDLELMPFHRRWLAFTLRHKRSLLLAPRGHGKTTLCVVGYGLYKILKQPNLRVLLISNTSHQARAILRELKEHLERNPIILQLFGNLVGDKWSEDEITLRGRQRIGKEATITAMGVLGPVISKHYDLVFLDDVVDEENASSALQREKIRTWYYKTLLPTLEPWAELHITGTRYHPLDLYGTIIQKSNGGLPLRNMLKERRHN